VRGICYICGSAAISSLMSVAIKWLSAEFPAVELTFFRCAFGFIPVAFIVRHTGGVTTLRTLRPIGHFSRAVVWVCSFILNFLSLHFLALADAIALSFLAPLFMTLLSVPMLGERVGFHRWCAVVVGFLGIVVMARPSGEFLNLGIIFGVLSALFWAIGSLSVRQLTRTETTASITFYTHFFAALILGVLLPFFWVKPSWQGLLAMGLVGLLGGISQFWATQAYGYAPAAAVAPFNYTQMVWAVILGFLIWGDTPGLSLLSGVGLIVASGLYILYREMRQFSQFRPTQCKT
jgi:drug/metabolite transporter (DMT)-like permease